MPHGVHAAMNPVEASLPDAMLDRARADAKPEQLPPCDHAVLLGRERRDPPVGATRGQFSPYVGDKCPRVGHAGTIAGPELRGTRWGYGIVVGDNDLVVIGNG
jgi:hypothetical protein